MSETKHTRPECGCPWKHEPASLTEREKAEKFVDEQLEKLNAHALSADDPQRTRAEARNALADCVASHDSLVKALEALLEAVTGEQRDPEELRKSLGVHAPAAVAQAEAALTAARKKV